MSASRTLELASRRAKRRSRIAAEELASIVRMYSERGYDGELPRVTVSMTRRAQDEALYYWLGDAYGEASWRASQREEAGGR